MEHQKRTFSWRAFVSISLAYSFIIIVLTGIILYLAPKGKIADWVDWHLFGLSKNDWEALHTIFSYSFLILSLFHLFIFNWHAFVSYIQHKTQQGLNKNRELLLATVLFALVFAGTMVPFPPFSYVLNIGDDLTQSWENTASRPPVPHAEQLTLDELANQYSGITAGRIFQLLQDENIQVSGTHQTLEEIAEQNHTTPMALHELIINQKNPCMNSSSIDRITLREIALEQDTTAEALVNLLLKNNITAKTDMTLRQIADRNSISAGQVYKILAPDPGQ